MTVFPQGTLIWQRFTNVSCLQSNYGKTGGTRLIPNVKICWARIVFYLGPTLFTLFTNDLPSSVSSGSVFMFADDTTVYCISETAEKSIVQLNSALRELNEWCLINRLTPHPSKSEAMLISRKNPSINIPSIFIGNSTIEWLPKSRLLGMIVDEKLT